MRFDRVLVISLTRRPERLEEFRARVPADFPFGRIEHFEAIDGKAVKHPAWWRQGGGAWGCYRSHLRIIEDALRCGDDRVMIFEDDATFSEDFTERALRYFAALPEDWKQAYLGGQHLVRPSAISGNAEVLLAKNINRTHAYAINGRDGLVSLYRHLTDTSDWMKGHHIDHHYGRLHRRSESGFYAPRDWICGQCGGVSDVSGKSVSDRWWQRTREPSRPREGTFVAVIGLHRSGSSATAMMLHKLGISMGDRLTGYEDRNGGGGEAVGLASICEWAARFPATEIIRPRSQLKAKLERWIKGRLINRQIAGGKYPHLCAMGDELIDICGGSLRVILCDRPLDESIESLKRRSSTASGWLAASDEQSESVQRWLWGERNRFIESLPHTSVLRLQWNETLANPARAVDEIVIFLGISPTHEQVLAAASHVTEGAPA